MKRGKDEDTGIGPMFPRLHVNDIDKRGPKAPPRNKMALYEQLSIPSQRFSHVSPARNSNSSTANIMASSSQVIGSENSKHFSWQFPLKHRSEKHFIQSSDSVAPLAHLDESKELNDEDFRVPIFIRSMKSTDKAKHNDLSSAGKMSLSGPSFFKPSSKTQDITSSRLSKMSEIEQKQSDSSSCRRKGDNPVNTSGRIERDFSILPELCSESASVVTDSQCTRVLLDNPLAIDKRSGSPVRIVLSSATRSHDGSSNSQVVNLERSDSVTEISIVASMNEPDITPDDVVRLIGQKCFFKARRAIANQQRVFSDQLFELHRLLKVQRSISSSSRFLPDITTMDEPVKALPRKTLSMDLRLKPPPNTSTQKSESEKPKSIDYSAENTLGKSSLSSIPNTNPVCFNQPQWLIPVMSPSEGLVYKPYPGTGFSGSAYGSWGMPGYGIPATYPPFPAIGPRPFFPAYSIPAVDTSFSSSSIEQVIKPSIRSRSSEGNKPSQGNSSLNDRILGTESDNATEKGHNPRLLSECPPDSELPARVIKVVPHKAGSVTESVARIFRSIEEDRKKNMSL